MTPKRAGIFVAVAVTAASCGMVAAAKAGSPAAVNATCTQSPVVSDVPAGSRITVVCTVPKAPSSTATVTATATATATVTATATATATATVTVTPTPEPTPTPTVEPTVEPTPTTPPSTGWPDASNTGWTGTLTPYAGPLTITTANTVIDSKTVTGTLVIRATGVVIRNSQVNGTVYIDEDSTGSVTVSDSVIDAGQREGTGIGDANFTVLRTEIIGGNRSALCWLRCVIRDSYVHGQFRDATGQAHESGIRMGAHNQIVHNSIVCDAPEVPPDAGCSANLTGYGDFATVEDNLIQGNLFRTTISGGFCAYGGSSPSKPFPNAHDIRFIDNVFERGRLNDHGQPDCGAYGPITDFNPSAPGNVWSNNTWSTGGAVSPN